MDRRVFLAGSIALLTAPGAGNAQQPDKVYRIGILSLGAAMPSQPHHPTPYWNPFIDEMRVLNYEVGRNLLIRYAGADAKPERLPALAAELVNAGMDVIVTTGPRETRAAKTATVSIPIVMSLVPDPVDEGLVASLAHPGGNVTGLSTAAPGLYRKYVELLKEVEPAARLREFSA